MRAQLEAIYTDLTHMQAPQAASGEALEIAQANDLGTGLASLERYQEALECYDRALAIDARHEASWVHRGTVLEALGRTQDTLGCCDHALQINPASEQALLTKGMMLGALGQIEEARTYCDRALKLNPRNEQAWINLGAALDALRRPMDALGCYNNTFSTSPAP